MDFGTLRTMFQKVVFKFSCRHNFQNTDLRYRDTWYLGMYSYWVWLTVMEIYANKHIVLCDTNLDILLSIWHTEVYGYFLHRTI